MGLHIWAVLILTEKFWFELARKFMIPCHITDKDTRYLSSPDHSTVSGAHKTKQSSYTVGSFPGVKKSGGEAKPTRTPPAGADFRNEYSDRSTPCMRAHYAQEKFTVSPSPTESLTTYILNTSRAPSTELGALVHQLLEI
jgi:hypothetical protein